MILSFGGLPLLYYGDEIGTLNNESYLDDPNKKDDTRWMHRPTIDWEKGELRNTPGTVEYEIFSALKRMIAVRKEIEAFADYNNRELFEVKNPHLFVFERYNVSKSSERVLIVANFESEPQHLDLEDVGRWNVIEDRQLVDLYTGQSPDIFNHALVIPGFNFYWISEI